MNFTGRQHQSRSFPCSFSEQTGSTSDIAAVPYLINVTMNITWFLFPLAGAISLVWNASRYESTELILKRSLRMFIQILIFMAIILAILVALSYKL